MFFGARNVLGSSIESTEMSFNTLQEVLSSEVTGSPVTSIEMDGLDLDTDGTYLIFFELADDGAAGWDNIAMFCNTDTTTTNYYNIKLQVDHGSVTGTRANTAQAIPLYSSTKNHAFIVISKVSGEKPMAVIQAGIRPDANILLYNLAWAWTSTANVTKLTFTDSESGGIGVGTKCKIYKVVSS